VKSSLRRATKRVERALLGAAMTMIAFVIERRVLKAIRERGEKLGPTEQPDSMEELLNSGEFRPELKV
jgi:hypothetical protein